jgi:hypothetical protein
MNAIASGTLLPGRYKITIPALNLNSVADTAIPVPFGKWKLARCDFHDASTTLALSLAVVGLYTAAAAGGTNLITSVVTGLIVSTDCISQTVGALTKYQTAATIYLRPTTAHGVAATCAVTLHLDDMT